MHLDVSSFRRVDTRGSHCVSCHAPFGFPRLSLSLSLLSDPTAPISLSSVPADLRCRPDLASTEASLLRFARRRRPPAGLLRIRTRRAPAPSPAPPRSPRASSPCRRYLLSLDLTPLISAVGAFGKTVKLCHPSDPRTLEGGLLPCHK
ncbi:hypothetical protein GUJ93_ZPchr0013g34829 [Zizania palustris]|uniref:Uncharacterized protein n=1 Tax=Zizania palustris TaxID=103762 RepID=A0A8J5X2V8_ZIZPA|nr:hypothetical protein GUJ93_ZPchr0013g34829 [Zizania palustris]